MNGKDEEGEDIGLRVSILEALEKKEKEPKREEYRALKAAVAGEKTPKEPQAWAGKSVLVVEHLCKRFGDKRVLRDVSFSTPAGKIFGLLGPNGAGKSTLIKILTGFIKPNSGSFHFFGKKFKWSKTQLSKHLGVVPQEEMFYRKFSVEENLSLFGTLYGLKGKELRERAGLLIKWFGLDPFKKKRAEELSGGYRRLLNIACSLIHNPAIVFLDEPTVGLDPKVRKMFWEKIKGLRSSGKSVLLTTHYMDEAEELCDEIAILVKGRVLVTGTPRELIWEYGGDASIILTLENEIDEGFLRQIQGIAPNSVVKARGKELFIAVSEKNSIRCAYSVNEFIKKSEARVVSSIIREPTLEDVFLNLVGKAEGVEHAQTVEAGVEGN